MDLQDEYFALLGKVYEHFGYQEDWRVIPLDDCRLYFWQLYGEGPGKVRFAKTAEDLDDDDKYYEDEIYTQRFLSKWVYRAPDYTMVCCDPGVDGNKFLRIFDNAKESK